MTSAAQLGGPERSAMEALMQQRIDFRDSDDLVCSNCKCEVMIKHTGDVNAGYGQRQYTCSCGTEMKFEHPEAQQRQQSTMATANR